MRNWSLDRAEDTKCLRLGYERRGVEITVLRAQLEDAGRALADARKENALYDPAAIVAYGDMRCRVAEGALADCAKERDEARGALDALRAAVRGWLVMEAGVGTMRAGGKVEHLCPDCDRGEDGAHEDACMCGKLIAILDATLARAEGQKEGT